MSDNNQRWGFSVRIFVPSGEPEGLRVIEKSVLQVSCGLRVPEVAA